MPTLITDVDSLTLKTTRSEILLQDTTAGEFTLDDSSFGKGDTDSALLTEAIGVLTVVVVASDTAGVAEAPVVQPQAAPETATLSEAVAVVQVEAGSADATLSEAVVLNVLATDTAGLVDAGEAISAIVRAPDAASLDDGTTQIVHGNFTTITDTDGFALVFESVVDGVQLTTTDTLGLTERAVPGPTASDGLALGDLGTPHFTLQATDQNLLDDRAVLVIEAFKGYLLAALGIAPRLPGVLTATPRLAATSVTIPDTDATLTVRPP